MTLQRRGKVYKVLLVPPDAAALFPSQDQYITDALSAGQNTQRYGREWIVGRTVRHGDILVGRIGFRGAEGMAEVWDEEAKDFYEIAVPSGLTAPFAVNLRTLQMILQPRGAAIKLHGLIGAFRSLLAQRGDNWRIVTARQAMTFAQWRASVDRVVAVRFRLHKPNPHWQGAPDLEAVMEGAEAETAQLELHAQSGIDTASSFVEQSQRHVERGYGAARYVGQRGGGTSDIRESVYNTDLGSEEEAIDLAIDGSGEVTVADLVGTLAPTGEGQDTGDDGRTERDAGN